MLSNFPKRFRFTTFLIWNNFICSSQNSYFLSIISYSIRKFLFEFIVYDKKNRNPKKQFLEVHNHFLYLIAFFENQKLLFWKFSMKSFLSLLYAVHVRIVFPVFVMNIDTSRNRCIQVKKTEARIAIWCNCLWYSTNKE